MLVKVSGSGTVLQDEEIRQALNQAQRFMQRYQYLRRPDRSLARTSAQTTDTPVPWFVTVSG